MGKTTPQPSPLTAEEAKRLTTFSLYRKMARTLISDTTFPPGTVYQTPEGLRAEDEETRAAFDVQGGVYPIRESVFNATYVLDAARAASPDGGLRAAFIAGFRKGQSRTGADEVRIEQLADEYAPAAPAGLDVERLAEAIARAIPVGYPIRDYVRAAADGIAREYDRAAARPAEWWHGYDLARPAEEEQRDPIDQAKARDDMRDGVAYQEWHGHTIETEIT